MRFAVIFHDKPGEGALRAEYLAKHLDWLDHNSAHVLVAGSLRTEPDAVPQGGMWVVEAPTKEDVVGLIESDPFFTSGLRASYELLHWSKAFPDRIVSI